MHNLKQVLGIKNVLKLVIHVTYNKTSNIMIITQENVKYHLLLFFINGMFIVHIIVSKGLQIGFPVQFQ